MMALGILSVVGLLATVCPWDADVSDYSRRPGEIGDSARIMRAVQAAGKGGVALIRGGSKCTI